MSTLGCTSPALRRIAMILLGCSLWLCGCDGLNKAKEHRVITLTSPHEGPASGARRGQKVDIVTPGRVLTKYLSRGEWTVGSKRGQTTKSSRAVVPLVDPDWKPGEPIPMWVSGAWLSYPVQRWDELQSKRESQERAWAAALGAALAKGTIRGTVTQVARLPADGQSAER